MKIGIKQREPPLKVVVQKEEKIIAKISAVKVVEKQENNSVGNDVEIPDLLTIYSQTKQEFKNGKNQ